MSNEDARKKIAEAEAKRKAEREKANKCDWIGNDPPDRR